MIIEKISFINVRKLRSFSNTFSKHTTIITGKNGQGKTSILEAIYILLTAKSFRKKYNKSIIKKEEKNLQIKGIIEEEKQTHTIKIIFNGKNKKIEKNNNIIRKASDLLEKYNIVCASPEEPDIIESYKSEKIKYFDKILFKVNKKHIKTIQDYNKLLKIRNTLLEENKSTEPWDEKIIEKGIEVWESREKIFKKIVKEFAKIEKKLFNKQKYIIEYKNNKTENKQEYLNNLKKTTHKPQTMHGPHKDNVVFKLNKRGLQEEGSQGEKKLFKYILKLTEIEILKEEKKRKPILLLDDFFAKLDDENIMKIFTYFHRKFQTIITTTTIKNTAIEKNIISQNKEAIKTIEIND